MNPFQWVADKIKGFKTPEWLKLILQWLQDLVVQISLQVGKEALLALEGKILEVSKLDISNEDKFNLVYKFAIDDLDLSKLKERWLDLLIEILVNKLKDKNHM